MTQKLAPMLNKFCRGVERGFQRLYTSNRQHGATYVGSIARDAGDKRNLPRRLRDSPVKIDRFSRFADRLANAAFSDGMDSGQCGWPLDERALATAAAARS
jgi:hypothetical protein